MRLRHLDALRAAAAGMVLLSHLAFWTGASGVDVSGRLLARGDAGVAVFFAITAFLLLRPHYRAALGRSDGPVPWKDYLLRRAARVLPAYWCALAAVLAVAALLPGQAVGPAPRVLAHVAVLQGYTGEPYQAFTQTWSLTTELTFYAVVPLLGRVLRRVRGGVGAHLALLGAAATTGLVAQGVAAALGGGGRSAGAAVLATCVLGHAAWFAVGGALALLVEARACGHPLPRALRAPSRWYWHDPATGVAAAAVVLLAVATPAAGPLDLSPPGVAAAVTKEAGYALLAGLLAAAAVGADRRRPDGGWAASRPVVAAAEISYGVFLWHVLALQVVHAVTGRPLFSGGLWWVGGAVLVLSVAAATASSRLVERPARTAVRRRTAAVPSGTPAP